MSPNLQLDLMNAQERAIEHSEPSSKDLEVTILSRVNECMGNSGNSI